jgi:hypothetical protein
MAHEIFVVCTNWPKCDGPGVAEYQFGIDPAKRKCGFCNAPMRAANSKEVDAYKKAHPELHPVEVEVEESE